MPTYKVQVNGNVYTASVNQTKNGKLKVEVNGATYETECATDEEILTWVVRSDRESIHAHTKHIENDKFDMWVEGVPFLAVLQPSFVQLPTTPKAIVGQRRFGGEIRALMPGRVTSIMVKEGELVHVGTPLLILEAMKMQNEITSPVAGKVAAILVAEGETVKKESLLIAIK
jgi:biotin carboxyl carrier protein